MNYRFIEMTRKTLIGLSLVVLCGQFTACKDDYELDDEGNYPTWLGGSIYEALKDPSSIEGEGQSTLSGSFTNYVRLIDDLGYAETLGKTGSKTVFVANDEAFARFYANNSWGVHSYDDLTTAMKKQLLYASMLDNALLVEMFSNISDGSTDVMKGQSLKHSTSVSVIDSITLLKGSEMPQNNSYWDKYKEKGIHLVMDNTVPMMVHFTEEQMTGNGITTRGDKSDFQVITGTPYNVAEHSAYIFRNKIISADITCKNGYIHQMQDVLVPPGNMAQVIRNSGESNLFSRMLDRFSAPYYDAGTTRNYNDYAQTNGLPLIDSIFQMRYMSSYSQGKSLMQDPAGTTVQNGLSYDPGWNNYDNGTNENTSKDIAAMFVPTDAALEDFFLAGEGKFLMEEFGKKANTKENLKENIDSIPLQNVQQLINNLMKNSFVGTVPSKFGRVMDEASDPMGLDLTVLNQNSGVYDVKIANNGVVYMLNKMFAPPSLVAVSAPVTLKSNMKIMNEAVNDGKNRTSLSLNLNYYAYLLAMSANYAFFIPTDEAFANWYVDPSSLADGQPRALKFFYQNKTPYVFCGQRYVKKNAAGQWELGDTIAASMSPSNFRSQLVDILNYHTVVLPQGQTLGSNGNKYYKTKHGATIKFDGNKVLSGAQITTPASTKSVPESNITQTYTQKNGVAYAIDNIIQAPQESVLSTLYADSATTARFSLFMELCNDFSMDSIMAFASDKLNQVVRKVGSNEIKRMAAYHTFAAKDGLTDNVNYFNSYNYTVYAPNNTAMQEAFSKGLPKWSDIKVIYDQYIDRFLVNDTAFDEMRQARAKALAMVNEINDFIRYHFQDNSVCADNVIESGEYATACSDSLGIRRRLKVSGGSGVLTVTDNRGNAITVNANDNTKWSNLMTRDYVLNKKNHVINTSSFAVVHEISKPLNSHKDTDRYDTQWTGANAAKRLLNYRNQFERSLYRRYDNTLKY